MPHNFTNEDELDNEFIEISDESDTVYTSDPLEEDTSIAENNEDPDSYDTSTDNESEDLKTRLKQKSANEQFLGTISKKSFQVLLNQAKKGDEDARDAILNDTNMSKYAQRKFPSDYDELIHDQDDTQKIANSVISEIERQRSETELEKLLRNKIKGEINFNKAKSYAKSLMKEGVEMQDAIEGALGVIRRNNPSHPIINNSLPTSQSGKRTTKIPSSAYQLGVNEFQLNNNDFIKAFENQSDFMQSEATSYTFKNGVLIQKSNNINLQGSKDNMHTEIY